MIALNYLIYSFDARRDKVCIRYGDTVKVQHTCQYYCSLSLQFGNFGITLMVLWPRIFFILACW